MNKEVEKIEPGNGISVPAEPMTPLQLAIESKADPEQLLKFMELQERYDANEAKKQYNFAVAEFKANAPVVTKDLSNTQFGSKYTSKGNLLNTVNPVLSKYGLNARFDLDQSAGVKVTCILTHASGHSESTNFTAPPDTSGKKNPIQEIKSTITYGQIITFESITGITSSDGSVDDDGNSFNAPELITADQSQKIHALLTDNDLDVGKFIKYLKSGYGYETIDEIAADNYTKVIKKINTTIEAKRKSE
jgi:ERF superfamily